MTKEVANMLRAYTESQNKKVRESENNESEAKYFQVKKGILEMYRAVKKYGYDYEISVLDTEISYWRKLPLPHNGGVNMFIEWWCTYSIPYHARLLIEADGELTKLAHTWIPNACARKDIKREIEKGPAVVA